MSEPNFQTQKCFSACLLAIEMKKIKPKMNKEVYLGLSILQISKILMYEIWYKYIKPKYQNNAKLSYMDTGSFIINIKTDNFCDANDIEKRFNTSNYEVNRPLSTGKDKKIIGLIKDGLGEKIMTEFVALRAKTYFYLMDDDSEVKKAKRTKKCVIKRILRFRDYKICLFNNKVTLIAQ